MLDKFLEDAVILQEDAWAFAGAPLKVQLEVFPRFTDNTGALDHLLSPSLPPALLLLLSVLLSSCIGS
jgi:hypothetical protein